jgi:sugar phosphate isomerase/epimerase
MIKHFALQSYLPAETGLTEAKQHGYSHWYIDFSLASEELSSWSKQRIKQLQTAIKSQQVSPVFHSNYKAPLASDLEELRLAAVTYIKKEIEIAAQFNAPLIIHAGAIVEPRLVKQVKQQAIQQYLISIN